MKVQWLPKKDPWIPPDYDDDAILAIRALIAGVANEGQQKLAWYYIMYVCGTSDEWADLSWRPGDGGGDRSTSFAEGKRFVGLMLRKLLRPELTPGTERNIDTRRLSKRVIAQRLRRQRERMVQRESR